MLQQLQLMERPLQALILVEKIHSLQQFSIISLNLPTESETIAHKIRIPCKIKYLRTLLYRFAIQ